MEKQKINTPRSHIQPVKKAFYGEFRGIVQSLLFDTEGIEVNGVLTKSRLGPNRLLQATARSGHDHMVRLFPDMGAEVFAEGGRHISAMPAAVLEGHEVVKILLAAGADPHPRGMSHGGPLLVAMELD